ncbi:hypothetical protein [Candidatus Uabimicrobium sp. HlEnr_7]
MSDLNVEKSNLVKVIMWSSVYFIFLLSVNEILRRSVSVGWIIFVFFP